MALKTYTTISNQSVYDIALTLYSDVRGISNLLSMNFNVDVNTIYAQGTKITYDDSVVYTKGIINAPVPTSVKPNFICRSQQSVFDLAIQLYGRVDAISNFIGSLVTEIGNPVTPGTSLVTPLTNNYFALNVFCNIIVATCPPQGGNRLLETGSFRLLEVSGKRLLEG